MRCPIVKYVQHWQVGSHLRIGWMVLADLGPTHGEFSVLMGWPCNCKMAVPFRGRDGGGVICDLAFR